jgi:uncharacterized membrane protein YccC
MPGSKNYLQEIQKFTTSQYWNSGVRITTGVIVPMLIMARQGWLSTGVSFLFGALFVSLTDTPGPIHHRRNGMLVAIGLNTFIVLITGVIHDHEVLLLIEVILFSFLFSLLGIYGARAGAVGTLALVIMLIHMSPLRRDQPATINALLTAGGGLWYATFSLLLYRFQPYRLIEQALGENLMQIADYIRARAAFYKAGNDVQASFNRMMKEQVDVLKAQAQMRELLFKTRQFVGDASPKSRSLMMIFLESLDLFEETMYSYQDYKSLQEHTAADLLDNFYRLILQIVAELEHIGLSVQTGIAIKRMPTFDNTLAALDQSILQHKRISKLAEETRSLDALEQTLQNIRGIVNRIQKIVLYTRMEAYDPTRFPDQELEKPAGKEPITFSFLAENFTFHSNHFRYAIRISLAMLAGYSISALFSLSHAYWVMLTILTILKPVYNLTRVRNIQRVVGTLGGVLLGSLVIFVISNNTMLVVIMIICMLMAYTLLRVNYLGFVIFLTMYVLITFHFVNPVQFKSLIGERLIDTLIGSVIAALAARFLFPVWQHYNIQAAIKKMLIADEAYLLAAWNAIQDPASHRKQYNMARNGAIVALTNLSDNFQQMLAEPGKSKDYTYVHQFVIASHTLTGRISALTRKDISMQKDARQWIEKITDTLQEAGTFLELKENGALPDVERMSPSTLEGFHTLSIIYSIVRDLRNITVQIGSAAKL